MKSITVFTLLILLLFSSLSSAAQFDIWSTGMTLNEVVQISKKYDIPISKSGVIGSNKGFDKKRIDEQFRQASSVGYVAPLLGVKAKVDLLLSPEWPNSVYEIKLRFMGLEAMSQQFKDELLTMLTQKYGSPHKTIKLLHKAYRWDLGGDDEMLLVLLSSPTLYYTDVRFKKYVENIKGYTFKNEQQGYTKKDAGRF
jgi:hypothetical protein